MLSCSILTVLLTIKITFFNLVILFQLAPFGIKVIKLPVFFSIDHLKKLIVKKLFKISGRVKKAGSGSVHVHIPIFDRIEFRPYKTKTDANQKKH